MHYARYRSTALLLAGLWTTSILAVENEVAPVKEAQLGATRNVHSCGALFCAGQPTRDDINVIKAKGIKRVITLRQDGEIDWDEAAAVKDAGLEFVAVPFGAPESLTDKVFDKVRGLLRESDKQPTVLHCGSANRVGAVWLTHRVLDQGVPLETALKEAKQIGLRTPAYEEKARQYIKKNVQER